jgi:hypothetical protein
VPPVRPVYIVFAVFLGPGCGTNGVSTAMGGAGGAAASVGSGELSGAGGSAGGVGCPGTCLPVGQPGFSDEPVLLWIGDNVPSVPLTECPPNAPEVFYNGFADLNAPSACGACSCGPAPCQLPVGGFANDGLGCQGPNSYPYQTPNWDGSCVTLSLPPFSLARSYSIDPTSLGACLPSAQPEPPPPEWAKQVLACRFPMPLPCSPADHICLEQGPTPGFSLCIAASEKGDRACPAEYPIKHVGYEKLSDTRLCSPCECGPPKGGNCTAWVSRFESKDCTGPEDGTLIVETPFDCLTSLEGTLAFQSTSAKWITNEPGHCDPSGGVPSGEATPTEPTTFCCRQEP